MINFLFSIAIVWLTIDECLLISIACWHQILGLQEDDHHQSDCEAFEVIKSLQFQPSLDEMDKRNCFRLNIEETSKKLGMTSPHFNDTDITWGVMFDVRLELWLIYVTYSQVAMACN